MKLSGKTVVVAVDFQGGPIDSDPRHGEFSADSFARVAMRNRAQVLLKAARAADVPVVWIQEIHKPHMQDIGRELDGSEGPHCIEGVPTTRIVDGLGPTGDEFLVQKRRYSAFFETDLDIVLNAYQAETLILFGGFTDICVLYTAVDAHQKDYVVRVMTDLVSGSSRAAHDDALEMIGHLQKGSLVTSEDVLEWIETPVPHEAPTRDGASK